MSKPHPYNRWRPHPWHGLEVGPDPPRLVQAYIEITPFDVIKYEIDKVAGLLRVDRPQPTSSLPPALYGFIPRTFCAERVRSLSVKARRGDEDPMDICVVSERPIDRPEVILNAKVIGGIQMIDNDEADDKIVSILENDGVWGAVHDISELPEILVERLRHYFLTYKLVPGRPSKISIEEIYNSEHAFKVIEASMQDYNDEFGAYQ